MPQLALSLKQPWAALLASGRKTIEVRRWSTAQRGRILIHAARVPDPRPEAWRHVTPDLAEVAKLSGGIIGVGELFGSTAYATLDKFLAEQTLHLNEPEWFEPKLFGFQFRSLSLLPFRGYPGWLRFFPVEDEPPVGA